MAKPRVFFDSNILIYTDDKQFPAKQAIATELVSQHLRQSSGVVSVQVLQEYYSATTGKLKTGSADAREKIKILGAMTVFQPAIDDIIAAINLHQLHKISFWDAMIVRAAMQSGTRILYTEDLQHGRRFDSLEIINPFL